MAVLRTSNGTEIASTTVAPQAGDLGLVVRLVGTGAIAGEVDVTDEATRDLGKVDIASLDQYAPLNGRLPVDGSGVTQPVSGTVTANAGTNLNTSGLLTDGQLRAVPVPVSGTVTATGPLTDAQLRATSVPVNGTVTVDAGTNLNTSLLALEAGGNLAAIKGKTDNLDVALSTRLKPADTLAAVTTVGTVTTVTNPVTVAQPTATSLRMAGGDAAGTPTAGTVLAVQGIASGTALAVSGTVTATGPLTDGQLRATPVPVSGTVTASGPLTDTQLRATPVPISGSVTATGGGYLTDGQLRATPVPVSGTVTASGPLTDAQLRATAVPISGTVTANPATAFGKTLTRVALNQGAAGTTQLAAASPGNKHKVLAAALTMSAAGSLKFTDGAGDLSGPMDVAQQGGFVFPAGILPYLETTVTNTALSIVTTTGAARGFVVMLTEP